MLVTLIICSSKYPAINNNTTTIPTSIAASLIVCFSFLLLINTSMIWKLQDIAIAYATISMNPKGDMYRIESGVVSYSAGAMTAIDAKPIPVDHPVYAPQTIPNPGTNIGSAA